MCQVCLSIIQFIERQVVKVQVLELVGLVTLAISLK